jgi:hypothetical protein
MMMYTNQSTRLQYHGGKTTNVIYNNSSLRSRDLAIIRPKRASINPRQACSADLDLLLVKVALQRLARGTHRRYLRQNFIAGPDNLLSNLLFSRLNQVAA